ncbi:MULTISPECIES: hypothetical protein [Streptomyces]|uniref:Uncharacterized protein n=1 Tax=Streptomyces rimosus subsp. rimosus TaxID=132474 RepID=A0ABY3YY94_STRRM|nr:hypothetical protein SRIMR7_03640 [Streptomyces rimosus subsp. rimosus]
MTRPPCRSTTDSACHVDEFRGDTYRSALAAVSHLDDEVPVGHRQREMQHMFLTRWLRQLLHPKAG